MNVESSLRLHSQKKLVIRVDRNNAVSTLDVRDPYYYLVLQHLCAMPNTPRKGTRSPPLLGATCLAPGGGPLFWACVPGARCPLKSWHPMAIILAIAPRLPEPLCDSLILGSVSVCLPLQTSLSTCSASLTDLDNISFRICYCSVIKSASSQFIHTFHLNQTDLSSFDQNHIVSTLPLQLVLYAHVQL